MLIWFLYYAAKIRIFLHYFSFWTLKMTKTYVTKGRSICYAEWWHFTLEDEPFLTHFNTSEISGKPYPGG